MSRNEAKRRWDKANRDKVRVFNRNYYRRKKGIPLDAPVQEKRKLTDEERRADKRERNRKWALANPEKVKAMRERYNAKRALDPEEAAARKKAKAAEYNRRYHARAEIKAKDKENSLRQWERRKNDPEFREKERERKRREYRIKRGLPPDAVLVVHPPKPKLTPEEVAAAKAARESAKAEKLAKAKEDAAMRTQRKAEQKAAAERAKRRAAPVVKQPVAKPAPAPAPVNANDPPELVELFRKASKGQRPMPYNPRVKKLSVWHLRGVR